MYIIIRKVKYLKTMITITKVNNFGFNDLKLCKKKFFQKLVSIPKLTSK